MLSAVHIDVLNIIVTALEAECRLAEFVDLNWVMIVAPQHVVFVGIRHERYYLPESGRCHT